MKINLKCGECKYIYDYEVGKVGTDDNMSLVFEHKVKCPKCGVEDKELLSETGQGQMTEWHLNKIGF